ncbi:MAG: alpha/beta fold hydrolase [Candidatus Nanopelagicales bacterium]
MSTPPFVAVPPGVAAVTIPEGPAQGLLAEPVGAPAGDVLLVPGFTGSKEDFIAVLAPLAERGWRVLAIDLPGQNGNPGLGPAGSHTTSSLAAALSRVAGWLSACPVHVVGHSMGGLITGQFVLDAPQRVASWSPLCSGPGTIPAHRRDELTALRAALGQGLPLTAIWEHNVAASRAAGLPDPAPAVFEFLHGRFLANDPVALADCAWLLLTEPDRTEALATLLTEPGSPQVSVVTGEFDNVWSPPTQQRWADDLGVAWIEIPGSGHSPAADSPDATAEILAGVFARAARASRQ